MILRFRTHTPEQTRRLGERIGRRLTGDETVFISGGLGAGKTLLTKGLAVSLGIDPTDVVSPTFTLINEYRRAEADDDHSGYPPLVHVDCYRLRVEAGGESFSEPDASAPQCFCPDGVMLPEIDELIGRAVVVVEWAQFLDLDYRTVARKLCIRMDITAPESRRIELDTPLAEMASLS